MAKPRVELSITLFFICAVLVGLFLTSRIDLAFSSNLETFSGPRAYPRLILTAMLVLFAAVAATQVRNVLRRVPNASDDEAFFDIRTLGSAALFLALLVFVLTFESVGYILTIVPLLVFVAFLTGARSPVHVFVVVICLSATCLVIFRYGLATVLPEGVLGIDTVF